MKNYFILFFIFAILFTSLSFRTYVQESTGALGDVKYSILPPDKFEDVNGKGWILLDGRNIKGSSLQNNGYAEQIPDARGMFIRGLNMNRNDDKADPFFKENNRARLVGEYQIDTFASHSHAYPRDGGPSMAVKGIAWTESSVGPEPRTKREGGNETRPKNVSLYVYIKIN